MIKKLLRPLIPKSLINEIIIRRSQFPLNQSREKREAEVVAMYKRQTDRTLDLSNIVTFSEKIQWLKLYYDHPDLSKIVCKYNFKKYIKKKLGEGYTVPLYGAWTDVKHIDFDKLPDKFVLKSNCSGGGNFIKIITDKSKIDLDKLKQELEDWLNPSLLMINSYCRAYWKVRPRIIAEQYVEQLDGQVYDYKFFCFGGKPEFAYVATDHFEGQISNISVYDLDWNRQDITYGVHPQNNVPAPKTLNEMIAIAKKLSKDFPFVRVDFFEVEGKPVLSELTFYPGGGFNEINPPQVDRQWGDLIILPKK